jgi:hypothetical protein
MMGSEDYYKKWFDDMKKWFEDSRKGMNFDEALFDQFNKQIEQFNSQTKNSWEQLLKIVQTSYVDSTQRTIETNAQAGPAFKTIIGLDGDLKNEFPTAPPEANNVYWVRHNQLVDEALATQKEIISKVIDTIGATIQKIVNPISFSSNDVFALTSLFRKPGS